MQYKKSKIKKLLNDALTNEEVIAFCYDHFEKIAEEVKSKNGKQSRILAVVDYVYKDKDRIEKLLDKIKIINPNKYELHKPYFVAENELPEPDDGGEKGENDEDEDDQHIIGKWLTGVACLVLIILIIGGAWFCDGGSGVVRPVEVDGDDEPLNIESIRINITNFDDKNKGDRVDFTALNRVTAKVLGTKSSGTQQWDDDTIENIVIELNPAVPLAECKNLKLEVKKVSVINEQHNWEAKLKITAIKSDGEIEELNSPLLNGPKLKWNIYKSSKTFDLNCP